MLSEKYYSDYPTEPIGKGNPYYCCSYCKRAVPEINGQLENHEKDCDYRKQNERFITSEKRKAEYRRLNKMMEGWREDKELIDFMVNPTEDEAAKACLNMSKDYSNLSLKEKEAFRYFAVEWLKSWQDVVSRRGDF